MTDTTDRLEAVKTMPRSVSQLNSYKRCPHAWYLQRVLRTPERPAAWLPQGTAVHSAAEAFERSGRTMTLGEAQDVYRDAYTAGINRLAAEVPRLDYWCSSGPYRGEQDIIRRYDVGLKQVAKYLAYYEAHPDETIWHTPDGEPGIELAFNVELGGVKVRGFIDAVVRRGGRVIVRDNKTGNQPGDDFQLAVYSVAVGIEHREWITAGDYWMGKSGKATKLYDLSAWTPERVAAEFAWFDEQIKAERFPRCEECPGHLHRSFIMG